MKARLAPLVGALLLASGCITFSQPAPSLHEYMLAYDPPAADREALPVVLRIAPLSIGATYAGASIVNRTAKHKVGKYPYDRWATDPATMVADLVTRDFASSGAYRAVLPSPSLLQGDYELSGEIEELGGVGSPGCVGRVQTRVLLRRTPSRSGGRGVLLQRGYQAEEPCAGSGRDGLVSALSKALQSVSVQIQQDVYAAIAADPERTSDVPAPTP